MTAVRGIVVLYRLKGNLHPVITPKRAEGRWQDVTSQRAYKNNYSLSIKAFFIYFIYRIHKKIYKQILPYPFLEYRLV